MKKQISTLKDKAAKLTFTLLYAGGTLATTLLILADSDPKLPRGSGD
jgi:hypothetical protein